MVESYQFIGNQRVWIYGQESIGHHKTQSMSHDQPQYLKDIQVQ